MVKNYIRIAFRNLVKNKGASVINILGLAVGMACCILILLWVKHELSFNRFHENMDSVYRVYQLNRHPGGTTPFSSLPQPLGPELQSRYPEIRHAVRLLSGDLTVRYEDKIFNEKDVLWIDPAFLDVFSFFFLKGSPRSSLRDPFSVILTQSAAEKYFGGDDPIGKVLTVEGEEQLKVTAVLQNPPDNSTIRFDFLVPYSNLEATGYDINRWNAHNCQIYIQLEKNTVKAQLEKKIMGLLQEHDPDYDSDLKLQPLGNIRLYTLSGKAGTIKYVTIFSLIAFFVLVIGSINFMSLSTARSAKRAHEVSLRKVVGARKNQLIRQFFGESLLICFIALATALVLVEILLPFFNRVSGKTLSLDLSAGISIFGGLLGIAVFTGILAGVYPAFFLSSFVPAKVLKGSKLAGTKNSFFRKALVVF